MFTTQRQVLGFVFGAILLAGAVAIAARQSRRADWRDYQRTYFARLGQPADIRLRPITPQMSGQPELCLTCHIGLAEISPSHPVEVFGCVRCHGGNGLTLNADQAHAGLRGGKNPSDLSVVQQSCGQGCHSGLSDDDLNHVDRVLRSLQATYAGGIAAVRFSFGAQPDDTPRYGIYGVTDETIHSVNGLSALAPFPRDSTHPVDARFAANCLEGGCHLSAEPRAAPYFYRATGCAACHILYENDGLYRGDDPTIPPDEPGHMRRHRLTTAIPFSQCNHCHNRGNYSLRQMEFLLREDLPPAGPPISAHMPAEGRRLREYYQPIGRFTLCEWELDCVECHTAQEAMGDGDIHPNQAEMEYIQCRTCHGTREAPPDLVTVTAEHRTALRQAQLNPNYNLQIGDRVILTERGELMGNIKWEGGKLTLTSKVTGKTYPVKLVMGSDCRQRVDQQESHYCHECHAYTR
ncbi:MAG: hypothetical protein D6796_16525 [Caldilineae bacterium]|nr:MAG: hypothetical protein D6796_16525 [Caldilineae bacterium]